MVRIVAILLVLSFGHPLDEPISMKGWRGIQPLHSTRADVEKLLGSPVDKNDCVHNVCRYYLPDLNVQFYYSRGDCKSGRGVWDAPPDTVEQITINPKPGAHWSNLAIDKAKFKVGPGGHIEGIVSYANEEDGFMITVDKVRDEVIRFYYFPPAKDKGLPCP